MKLLSPLQKSFLKEFFSSYFGKEFYLSAGTALSAFYLKHRESEDLDLFTQNQSLDLSGINPEVARIADRLGLSIEHHVSTPTFLQFICQKQSGVSLKVDVVRELPPHFGEIKEIDGLFVDSLENIAASKILSIYGRFDAKDFIDLYFLIKEKHLDLGRLIVKAKKKYPRLNEFYLAGNLADAKLLTKFPATLRGFDKEDLIKLFSDLATQLFQKLKPEE